MKWEQTQDVNERLKRLTVDEAFCVTRIGGS
jgi:hypothetical protein